MSLLTRALGRAYFCLRVLAAVTVVVVIPVSLGYVGGCSPPERPPAPATAEPVGKITSMGATVYKLKVDGGTLYAAEKYGMVFVPDPKPERQP